MATVVTNSGYREAMDAVEALPLEDQAVLVDVVRHRLAQSGRARVVAEVLEAKTEYSEGNLRRGTVEELLAEIAE